MMHSHGKYLGRLLFLLAACVLAGCATLESGAQPQAARQRRDGAAPKVGDDAPLFTLKMLHDESKEVELAGYSGKKPVILFFGSYT